MKSSLAVALPSTETRHSVKSKQSNTFAYHHTPGLFVQTIGISITLSSRAIGDACILHTIQQEDSLPLVASLAGLS